jgi:outer membrane protein TolC
MRSRPGALALVGSLAATLAAAQEPPTAAEATARLSLPEAVTLALEKNLGLQSSVDAEQSARLRLSSSRAEFLPKLTPRYARSPDQSVFGLEVGQRIPWLGGQISAAARASSFDDPLLLPHSSELVFSFSQPLLRGFGPTSASFDLKNARRALAGQERAHVLARQNLMVGVTAAFYQVARQRQLLEVAVQSQKRSETLMAASAARMEVGLASRLDVLRAELQASQAQDASIAAQAALDTALEQFRILLGLPPSDAVEPAEVTLAVGPAEALEPAEALVARAFENRLELREAADQIDDAERSRALARQNLLPQLDLRLEHARLGFGSSYADAFRRLDSRTSVFLSTSYPVERTADRSAVAVAELDLAARRRGVEQRRFEVEAEVRAAARNVERIRKSIELQQRSVELAEQQQRLANLRYQRGLASNFDVVDAEANLVAARTALVGLLADQRVAWVQLQRATGVLDLARELPQ